ncbi:MAG: hypothetical protein ACFFBP_01665 [Promethearchaeota archaeon]
MKLRLTLKTKIKNEKEMCIKFNMAPSKHLGFINFVNYALNHGESITISLEKVSKSGEREENIVTGSFKFQEKK